MSKIWTKAEEAVLFEAMDGKLVMTSPKAKAISRKLPGRSVDGVKSHWSRVKWDRKPHTQAEILKRVWAKDDAVNHPSHYTAHPSGVECITVTEHFNFNVGNAIKYLWRADHKAGLEDLKKAEWYVAREIKRRSGKRVTIDLGG